MKKILILFILLFSSYWVLGQQKLDSTSEAYHLLSDIQDRQMKFSRGGMYSLNSWAVANITYGSIAYFNSHGEAKYFHQMNMLWNVVNLGIAIPGLIKTYKKKPVTFESVLKAQKQTESIYLFNAGLDLGYIASGWALRNLGFRKTGEDAFRLKGYGSSLMMQGGFLLLHDVVEYILYKTNSKRFDRIFKNISIEPAGLGMRINFH